MELDIQARIREEIELAAENSIIANQEFLDDEQLSRERQFAVLTEIFNANIRSEEVRSICNHFAPIFQNGHPIHLSLLGKTGTGKSITVRYLLQEFEHHCRERNIEFRKYHLDLCCPAPCFRALNNLACLMGASRHYKKGISLEELMVRIELKLSSFSGYVVIFIDEADNIRRDFNTFYQFLIKRLPQQINARLILIFVSNRLNWSDNLDPRVKSVLKVRELMFDPYNADDLFKILQLRVEKALRADKVNEGVIPKIAAYASLKHGDARKAIDLLTRSAYIAENSGLNITLDIVDQAAEEIEQDKYIAMIHTSPKHIQAALYAALTGRTGRHALHTGDAYMTYERFCNETGLRPLSQRAFSDILSELDTYGFIRARTVSRGRYGRSKEIHVPLDKKVIYKILQTIRNNFDLTTGVLIA